MWPAGDAQGSVDWFHNLRIHFYTRIRGAKFIVKNLAHLRRVTKDTPDHGHRDGGGVVLAEEAADDDRGPGGEFPACVGENLRGKIVVAGGDDRKQNGEVGRRNRVCGAGKIDQRVDAPWLQKSRRKLGLHAGFRNFFVPIGGAQNGADGSASNPVSGTFVADGKSPASGAGGSSMRVAAIGDGTGARNDNDARARVECSFERDLHVANHINRSGEKFRQGAANNFGQFRAGSAGSSDASAGNLCGRNAGGGAGLADGALQRLASLELSDANHIAWSGCRGGKQVGFIAYGAGSLRTSAVDAEIVGHGLVLTQSCCQLAVAGHCSPARRGLQSLTRGKAGLLP